MHHTAHTDIGIARPSPAAAAAAADAASATASEAGVVAAGNQFSAQAIDSKTLTRPLIRLTRPNLPNHMLAHASHTAMLRQRRGKRSRSNRRRRRRVEEEDVGE